MTDAQITEKLELILKELEMQRQERSAYVRAFQDKRRTIAAAVARCDLTMLANPDVRRTVETVPRSKLTVELIEYLVEMEIGELAFKDAVISNQIKMLMNEHKIIETIVMHTASVRKAGG